MASRRSRVLYICGTPLVPSKIGPARRNHHIAAQLSRFYDLTVIAYGTPADESMLRDMLPGAVQRIALVPAPPRSRLRYGRKVWQTFRGRCDYLPGLDAHLRSTCARLSSEAFDAVILSTLLLRGLARPAGIPVVADTHNVEYDVHRRIANSADSRARRLYARRQWPATKAVEQRSGCEVDLVLATSERDRRIFQAELNLDNVVVIPNGIDLQEFRPAAAPVGVPIIVFSGLMSYYPNDQGIRWFVDRILPRVVSRVPGARLVVAGAAPPAWLRARAGDRVEVTGAVPDIRPHLRRARAVVVPLKIGGGTRVKILEAQATGKPVISTAVGAEGLGQEHGRSILIADDEAGFAEQVVQVLTNDVLAGRIAAAGRQHVVAHFDWDEIGNRLARTLQERLGLAALGCGGELRSVTC